MLQHIEGTLAEQVVSLSACIGTRMIRWCRIVVLVLVGFYAVTSGMISSPLAATGSNCVGAASGADDCLPKCDPGCPPVLCIVTPYVAPLPSQTTTALAIRQVAYPAAKAERLASHAPDPALRPPSA